MSVAIGAALTKKMNGDNHLVFSLHGDGELDEGQNWEAIMFASQHGLDHLNLIVDDNRISMLGYTDDIVSHGSLSARLSAFGWDCLEVDGHDVGSVQAALLQMKANCAGKPKALIARTLKGHGVPGLENAPLSHVTSPKPELIDSLLEQNP
jgi:transketolase